MRILTLGLRMVWVAVPKWNLDRVQKLSLDARVCVAAICFKVVLGEHQKVILVGVKFMVL